MFKFSLTLLLSAFLQVPVSVSQNEIDQADAALKFARYTEWPDKQSNSHFIIYTDIQQEYFLSMQQIMSQQTVDNKKVKLKKISEEGTFQDADMVWFVTNGEVNNDDEIINKLINKPILTVTTDKSLLNKGVMFYFRDQGETIDYLYNKEAVLHSGLSIKSTLLKESHCFTVQ